MFSLFNIIIFILWLFSAVIDYSEFCYIWQLKEYRWDRFRDFLATRQGKVYWTRYSILWRSLVAIFIFLWPFNSVLVIKYALVVFFIFDIISQIYRLVRHKIILPVRTKKAIVVIASSMAVEGGLFFYSRDWTLLFLLIILRFIIISSAIIVFQYPNRALKRYYILHAAKKLGQCKNLIIIGITGSYGKTSVKEFLSNILSAKFNVVKTPKNINTEIGIADFILKTDFSNSDIFVVEMGAYRVGEIAQICEMVKPSIGVLTAINQQHLSLFGSVRKIQQAKYELLRSLPKSGLAITNADNIYCKEFLSELDANAQTFGADAEFNPDCLITGVKQSYKDLSCSFKVRDQAAGACVPILGEHNCSNIAPCILVGLHLGMDLETIMAQAKKLKPLDQKLKFFTYGNTIIIDDSYNSNPEGFCSALHLLGSFPSDRFRVVITRGMIELGGQSDDIHERIGGEIAYCADELVLISKNAEIPLRKGVGNKYRTKIVLKENPEELFQYLLEIKNKKYVILLESRIPEKIYQELTAERSLEKIINL